jgi:ADP-ribosyl-[dinitrogen reductase] hydrolase
VILAEALLTGDRLHLDDLASRLVRWARESGRGMGLLTGRVLARLADGVPAAEAARAVWEESGRTSAGNGAVMRCAPVALRWRGDRSRLVSETSPAPRSPMPIPGADGPPWP